MKILELNRTYDSYFLFPAGIDSLKDFITFLNEHYHTFIPMVQLLEDNCVKPYFIQEDVQNTYVNVDKIISVREIEGQILPRAEYEKRLKTVVNSYCVNCVRYEEDQEGDNLSGHREKLCLDGTCWYFKQKK